MTIEISLLPERMQLDVIHEFLARSYWSPRRRREVLEQAIAHSIVAPAAAAVLAAIAPRQHVHGPAGIAAHGHGVVAVQAHVGASLARAARGEASANRTGKLALAHGTRQL